MAKKKNLEFGEIDKLVAAMSKAKRQKFLESIHPLGMIFILEKAFLSMEQQKQDFEAKLNEAAYEMIQAMGLEEGLIKGLDDYGYHHVSQRLNKLSAH